jgi:hypothetical protein
LLASPSGRADALFPMLASSAARVGGAAMAVAVLATGWLVLARRAPDVETRRMARAGFAGRLGGRWRRSRRDDRVRLVPIEG